LLNPEEIAEYKKNLEKYRYDNEKIMNNNREIFFGEF
jgi:hypothetical protein